MKARIIEERCIGCGLCVNVCPQHAIELVGEKKKSLQPLYPSPPQMPKEIELMMIMDQLKMIESALLSMKEEIERIGGE